MAGTAPPSFVRGSLEETISMDIETREKHREVIKDAAGMVFVGKQSS